MKLHLPIGLRKALMAVLAVLPTASVVSSFAFATAKADTVAPNDDVIRAWVTDYNEKAAVNGGALIYNSQYGEEGAQASFNISVDSSEVSLDDIKESVAEKVEDIKYVGGLAAEAIRNASGDKLSQFITVTNVESATYNGAVYGTNSFDKTEIKTVKGTVTKSLLDAQEAGKSLTLVGDGYDFVVGDTGTSTEKYTSSGTVSGNVSVHVLYDGRLLDIDETYTSISYTIPDYSYTEDVTINYVKNVTLNYGAVNYVLNGGESLVHDSSISMADDAVANSIVIGSAVPENGVASAETKAELGATSMDLNANSIVVQGGSSVYASEGALKLGGDSVSVLDGSGLMAQEVIVNADGAVSFAGGSGIGAGTVNVKGNTISLSNAQLYATCSAVAPELSEVEANAISVEDADMKLHAEGAIQITDNTNIGANLVDVTSTSGAVTVTNSSIYGALGVNLSGKSLALTGATVETNKNRYVSDVVLSGTDSVLLAGGTSITGDNVVKLEGGVITLQEGSVINTLVNRYGNNENSIVLDGKKVELLGTGDADNRTLIKAQEGGVLVKGTSSVTVNNGARIEGKGNVTLQGDTISLLEQSIESKRGTVSLIGGSSVTVGSEEAATNSSIVGYTGINVSADKISISDKSRLTIGAQGDGAVTLTGKTSVSVENAVIVGQSGVQMSADKVQLSGAQVIAHDGNVSLQGSYANEITGGTVDASGNVTMTGGVVSIELSALNALGNLTTNTVSGATIEADGAFNMTGLKLKTEEEVEGGESIVKLYTVGSNVITDGATVNAGSVKLDGLTNTISGTSSVTGAGNVVLGEAGLTLYNSIEGANVTSNGGDIVLNGQMNTVATDATLTSTTGSILLNGSTAEGVMELMGTEIWGNITVGSILSYILPKDTNFDFTLNNVNGNLVAGKSISLDSTLNLLSGGEWKATDGVSYTLEEGKAPELRAITVDGAVNVLTGSNLLAENGNINLIANESIADGLAESLISLAGKYITIPESLTSVVGMLDMGGVNVMTGGSLDAKNGSILLDSTANVITGGTVNASGVVTLDGTINTVTGGSINGGSVVLNAKDGELNLSEIIGGIVDSLSKDDSEQGTGDEIVANDETLTEEDENQVTITGGANSLMGGEIKGGDVTLAATANLVTNGSITADNAVKFDGAINAVTGGTITGGSVDFFASEGNTLDLTGLLDSLSGVLGGNKQDGSTDADGNPTVGEGQMNWTDVIGYLGDALSGNTNLVIGGEVKATSGDVTMDGTLNVLTGGTVSAEQGTVQLTGLANVLVGGTVNNSNAAELNGSINAVLSGTLEGGSVTMNGAKDGLNLGEVLVPVLGSAGVDSSITDLVGKLGTINGNINLVTGGTVNATSGNATMNGTLNLLTGGSVNATDTATLNGAANVLVGGELSGANVVMQQGATGINLGGVIKPLLESAGVGAEITDLVGNLGEINGNINVVTGNAVVNGTDSVKMDSLANVVMGEGAQVNGGKVTLTGTQSIDLPLGTIINGLASQYVELPEAVTGVLGSLDGKIGLNTNVIIDGGSVSATDKAKLDASVNYIGNGGSVSGANLVELTGPMNLVLSNGSLTSENGTVRMNGYGPSLNELGVQIPAEYAEYANKLGLSGLLNKQFGVNLVMGEGATVTGKAVELNAGLMNMVADRAQLTADNNMTLSGATNIVVDGSTLTAGGTLSMSGSLNLVSHLVLNDFVNAIQNGTPLPTDGALTTLSGQDVQLWGAANVVHGNVLVTATGDVVMDGMGEPLFELSTMTVQQVVDLARELGVPALLDEAKTEVLNALMDYAAENNMSDLVEAAAALGLKDQLSGIYSDLKDFVKENGDAALNLSFNGNVNTVSGGAMVNGNGVYMNGTINYVGDLASVTGNTVQIDGITNVVAGGAEVTGGDITLSGGVNVLVDTTLDNVKDAIANGNLDSIIAGGKDQTTVSGTNVTLDAEANLINGYVAVTADNAVTMQGITNVVAGGATVEGKGSVNMDAVANVIAGGASVSGGDINMTGGMNAVVDTTLGNVVDALQQQSLAPLMQGGSEQTTLTATGDINLGAALNVVNGGKVVLEAGDAVNMTGAVNVFSGNTKVNATDINMTGMEVPEFDLSGILPAEYSDLANEIVEEGLNLSVVAGGAKLTAENDITLSGVAGAVVDTSMTNVLDALKQQSIDPLLQGGNIETVLTAGNDINLISKLNVVNGGKVTLTAGNDVTMAGVLNVVNGNSVVKADNAINMDAAANLVSGGANLTANNVSIGGNAALSDEFAALIESVIPGVELPSGVSAGVVMGNGTSVNAGNRVEMLSNVNVVADSAEINAKTARLAGTLNAVATDAAVSADKVDMLGTVGNLVLDGATVAAKGNATMTGAANVVQGATVTAETGNINMEALGAVSNGLSEVVDKLLPDAATAERVNDLLAQGNANAVVDGAQLNAAGNVSMKAAANVVDNSTVSAGGNVAMSSSALHTINNATIQSVSGNVSISGGIATVTGSTVTAEQGRINFSDVNIAMSGGSMYAADGMTVANGSQAALSDVTLGGESVIELDSSLNISNLDSMGDIENFGSLSLENAVLSGATLYNAGSVMVSNKLTLDSATLSFVADENNVTLNHTAIVLGDGFQTLVESSGDMLAGLHFELNYGALDFIADDSNVFNFKLALFEGITEAQTGLLDAALADGEFSITLTNGFRVDGYENVDIVWENNVAYVTGSASVPEPTTATLSLLALAALAARRRRK